MCRDPDAKRNPLAAVACLGGTLHTVSASLLSGERGAGLVPLPLPAPAQTLCHAASTPVADVAVSADSRLSSAQ
eukprot:7910517-Lingulodinium_polyedra.AAC.1